MIRAGRSDGDLTKSKILDAAGRLFAQDGFAKTTNKAIAKLAEVDLAAINYHFNGRDGLYIAVLIEAHTHYIDEERILALLNSSQTPTEKLEAFFETLVDKLIEPDPWHSKVFFRELFSPTIHLYAFMQTGGANKFLLIKKIISQVSGIDENHPGLLACVLSTMAPCIMLIIADPNLPEPLKSISKIESKVLVKHLMTFSLAGLEAAKQLYL